MSQIEWKKVTVLSSAVTILIFSLSYGHAFFFNHELIITVDKIDAPTVCHDGRSILHPSRYRTSIPEQGHWGFCGGIRAENGRYMLPTSSEFLSPHAPRRELLEVLEEGCEFRVKIVGSGPPFQASEGLTNRNTHIISKILEELPCPEIN